MSLPHGFLDELRARTSLARVVGRKVTWDARKSNPGKGDLWAPCPFHQEKTASFHVDDRKGYYYCFGCHAKGDALTFLRETANMTFMEAVEELAREAGMAMPAQDPQAAQKADRRRELSEVLEAAARHYRLQLAGHAGAPARAYLARRKVSPEMQDRFGLGFAPDDRRGLVRALGGQGIGVDLLVDAGLAIRPDDGGEPYDRFRGRVMFPIRDGGGRMISFGGRALDPSVPSKYLNGSDTLLFDKGRTLYNLAFAREAAAKAGPVLMAEGYMDVIALSQAGFAAAVAPLGTAVTADQLQLLWRLSPEPVVILDGDKAGLKAALRVADLALPLLEAGRALRFATLPEGLDPDDLIRERGAQAMTEVIAAAEPMVNLLWRREIEGRVFDSPERRAALDRSLRAILGRIADPSLRRHYGDEFARLRQELFAPARPAFTPRKPPGAGARPWPAGGRAAPAAAPLPATRSTLLAAAGPQTEEVLREAMILAIAINHPEAARRFEAQIESIALVGPGHAALRAALLDHLHGDPALLPEKLAAAAGADLEKLFAMTHVQIAPPVSPDADGEFAAMCLAEELAKLEARRGVQSEIEDAMADLQGLADEGVTWRLGKAAEARHRAERSRLDDTSDMGEDRAALSASLQRLIDAEVWVKKRR